MVVGRKRAEVKVVRWGLEFHRKDTITLSEVVSLRTVMFQSPGSINQSPLIIFLQLSNNITTSARLASSPNQRGSCHELNLPVDYIMVQFVDSLLYMEIRQGRDEYTSNLESLLGIVDIYDEYENDAC